MKRLIKALFAVIITAMVMSHVGCNKKTEPAEIIVNTLQIQDITNRSAVGGGTVKVQVIECGICWGQEPNPSIIDEHIVAETTYGDFSCNITSLTPNTNYHTRAYAITNEGVEYGSDVAFTTLLSPEYVDLGLPSGSLWATCNIGAETPEDYGYYFCWASLSPKGILRYIMMENAVKYLTKYCNNPSYGYEGYSDDLTVIQPSDDAANIYYGCGWHIPTYEEWQELVESCTFSFVIQEDVSGVRFSAPNGNSIFLPAAGRFDFGVIDDVKIGYYWSSLLYEDYPFYAWGYTWNSLDGLYGLQGIDRYIGGGSVRPVHSAIRD
ncbi:MAG: hypothetical protein J6P83_10515 [Bacteroidales bacterium]|nr:hypothetical protein [Bacteroidales bacterium]